ncbi:hypothetical protein V8C26DRAFT_416942 [Trichoderma gracile]
MEKLLKMSYPWGVKGLDKSRFEAYAKLLRLKNGGQIEEASNFSEMPDEEAESNTLDDADSVHANAFSMFDERKLKRAFLDRLSELVANEKGGYHVSSSLMIEWPDRVDILVARNNGFREADATLRMLETIASSLRDISRLASSDPVATSVKQQLLTSLVQSYKHRLSIYVGQAKRALKAISRPTEAQEETLTLADRAPSLLSRLEGLRSLIDLVTHSPSQDSIEKLIQSAHDAYRSYNEHDFKEITSNLANTRSLRDALGYLGRLQTCFDTLVRSAERLPSFQNLQILPVIDTPTSQAKPTSTVRNNAWSLAQTFSSLGLTLDDKTVASIVGSGKNKGAWTKNKLLQKFDKLKASISEVHAEMRVILAATKHDCTGANIFRYVGCSKRSCFLCSRTIQHYGGYSTRGCHGKLYNLWTVPQLPSRDEKEGLKLVQALKNVERAMKESIRNGNADGLPHAPESSIGGSSVATTRQLFSQNAHTMTLVSDYLRSQRQGMGSDSRKLEDFTSPGDSSLSLPSGAKQEANLGPLSPAQTQGRSATTSPRPQQLRGECEVCDMETDRHCEFCSRDWFCSRVCQDQMSFYHLTKCSARSITSADILCQDAIGDQLPKDPEALEHFGFTRCRDGRERSHLLGLYQGLLHLGVGAVQLNDWRETDMLVSSIIEKFSKVPAKCRGSYFPWFVRNQHILDISRPPLELEGKDHPILRAVAAARPYLDPEDRAKEVKDLEPESKRDCFLMYAMALDGSHPNPSEDGLDLWYSFGFATCRDEYDESRLGFLYSCLIGGNKSSKDYDKSLGINPRDYPDLPTCSFNEFWVAYETGTLPKLLHHYVFNHALRHDSGLREFLSVPPSKDALRQSVWRLKHFLALEPNTPLSNFPMIEAAAQEYGFTPQLDARTRLALRQFYAQLFENVDPLTVHGAKDCGILLECAETSIDAIDDGVRHVLRRLGSEARRRSGRLVSIPIRSLYRQ